MKRVAISDDVWAEIARRGKFGETEDDVLRRVFDLKPLPTPRRATGGSPPGRGSLRYATKVMRPRVKGGQLSIEFEDGIKHSWQLPSKSDKEAIRRVREAAVKFATQNGATRGQELSVMKALTEAGYYLTK